MDAAAKAEEPFSPRLGSRPACLDGPRGAWEGSGWPPQAGWKMAFRMRKPIGQRLHGRRTLFLEAAPPPAKRPGGPWLEGAPEQPRPDGDRKGRLRQHPQKAGQKPVETYSKMSQGRDGPRGVPPRGGAMGPSFERAARGARHRLLRRRKNRCPGERHSLEPSRPVNRPNIEFTEYF